MRPVTPAAARPEQRSLPADRSDQRQSPAARLVARLRRARAYRRNLRDARIRLGLRTPRRKRKLALAASVSVMALNTAAIDLDTAAQQSSVQQLDPYFFRVDAAQLKTSDSMKEALIEEEGVHYRVYRDVAGYPTVGVGHLVLASDRLRVGDTISERRALEFLDQDLEYAEQTVRDLVGDMQLYQHEFDALVDLAFNVGGGTLSKDDSPALNAAIEARDYRALATELEYHHAAGEKARGLVYRSERRTSIFQHANYENPR